jgi:NAD/NADP transhydrogenase beta subunit
VAAYIRRWSVTEKKKKAADKEVMPEGLQHIGKVLIVTGAVIALTGAVLLFSGSIPWFGKLPGDIFIERKNFTFYFPLATSIVISILLTLLFLLFGRR